MREIDICREEIARLQAENAELRATLAAEQGKQEGAPSEGWVFGSGYWVKPGKWLVKGRELNHIKDGWLWVRHSQHENSRAAMQHADQIDGVKP